MQKDNKEKKSFYLALYSVATVFLLLAFGITILNSSSDKDTQVNNEPVAAVDKSNTKPISEITTNAESSAQNTTQSSAIALTDNVKAELTTEITTNSSASSAVETQEKTLSLFNDGDEMHWPVSGQILMDYSPEAAIYDNTLEQYRTTDSICISAALGSEVEAGADGTVTSITKDNENGVTVSVDHGNGWCSTYSQLQDNLAVSEGQAIYKGDKIGLVAEPTKYSVAMGPHIEFSVFKNDEATDPKLVLASLD